MADDPTDGAVVEIVGPATAEEDSLEDAGGELIEGLDDKRVNTDSEGTCMEFSNGE